MLKTLAGKHRTTVTKTARKHKAKIRHTARATHMLSGDRRTRRQEATGRPVRRDPAQRQRTAVSTTASRSRRRLSANELINRLLADDCELCEHGPRISKFTTSASSPTSP